MSKLTITLESIPNGGVRVTWAHNDRPSQDSVAMLPVDSLTLTSADPAFSGWTVDVANPDAAARSWAAAATEDASAWEVRSSNEEGDSP